MELRRLALRIGEHTDENPVVTAEGIALILIVCHAIVAISEIVYLTGVSAHVFQLYQRF